jgi:hypothetical protein
MASANVSILSHAGTVWQMPCMKGMIELFHHYKAETNPTQTIKSSATCTIPLCIVRKSNSKCLEFHDDSFFKKAAKGFNEYCGLVISSRFLSFLNA